MKLKEIISIYATALWRELRFEDGILSGFITWVAFSWTAGCVAMLIFEKLFHQLPNP